VDGLWSVRETFRWYALKSFGDVVKARAADGCLDRKGNFSVVCTKKFWERGEGVWAFGRLDRKGNFSVVCTQKFKDSLKSLRNVSLTPKAGIICDFG
jgi:hypothetical protein